MKWFMFFAMIHIAASCQETFDCSNCIASKCTFYVTGSGVKCVPKAVKMKDVRYKVTLASKCNMAEAFVTKSINTGDSVEQPSTVESPLSVKYKESNKTTQQINKDPVSSTTLRDKPSPNPIHTTDSTSFFKSQPTSLLDVTHPDKINNTGKSKFHPNDKTTRVATVTRIPPQINTTVLKSKNTSLKNIEPTKLSSIPTASINTKPPRNNFYPIPTAGLSKHRNIITRPPHHTTHDYPYKQLSHYVPMLQVNIPTRQSHQSSTSPTTSTPIIVSKRRNETIVISTNLISSTTYNPNKPSGTGATTEKKYSISDVKLETPTSPAFPEVYPTGSPLLNKKSEPTQADMENIDTTINPFPSEVARITTDAFDATKNYTTPTVFTEFNTEFIEHFLPEPNTQDNLELAQDSTTQKQSTPQSPNITVLYGSYDVNNTDVYDCQRADRLTLNFERSLCRSSELANRMTRKQKLDPALQQWMRDNPAYNKKDICTFLRNERMHCRKLNAISSNFTSISQSTCGHRHSNHTADYPGRNGVGKDFPFKVHTATRSLAGERDGVVLKKSDKDGGEESDLEWEPNHDLIDKYTYNNKDEQGKRYTEEDDDDDYVPRSKKTKGTRRNGVGRSVSKTERSRKLLNKGVTRVSTTGNPKYTAFYRGHTKHYACIQCPATDTYPSLMEAHLKLHEEGSGAIPCPDCGWLVLPDRMNYHYGKRHPLPGGACRSGKKGKKREEKRYHFKCPECKALLTSVGKYREHEELHASGGGQVCKRCGWLCKRMSNHKAYWHVPHRKIPQREIKLMKKRGENDYLRRKHGGSRNLEGNEESHSNGAFNDSLAVMNAKWNAEMEEELNIKFSASAASCNPSSPVSEHHSSLFLDSDDDLIRQEEVNAEPQLQTQVESDFLKKSRSNSSKKIVIHSLDTSHPKYTRYYKGPTRYYGCRECPAEDSYLKLLEAHMKLHEEGSGAIPCPECGWLVMPDKLSFHKGKHHRPADLPTKPPNNLFYFKCPDCKALLCSVGRYRDHEQMHENGKGKNCAICGWLVKEVGRHSARWHPTDPKSAKGKIMYPRKIKLMKKRTENKLQSSA